MFSTLLKSYFFWIIVIIIIIGVVIFYWGRKSASTMPPAVDYPHGGSDIPSTWSAVPLANQLHENLSGLNLPISIGRDTSLLSFLKLDTDEMFIAVYDTFNKLYMKEDKGTLRQWIKDEIIFWPGDNIRPDIYVRMDKLNLQ